MMIIRLMKPEDAAQIAALEKLCFSMPWSLNSIEKELENPLSLWLVAVAEDAVAGYVGSQTVMDEADMMNIAVQPQFRRQGIAKALIEELIKQLSYKQVKRLTLEVRASNVAAVSLYEEMGFSCVGRRPGYYRMPKEDALILRKEWDLCE